MKPDDYPLFIKWMEILDWVLDRSEKFPKSVRFSLAGRVMNSTFDILDLIVEAIYTKNRKPVLVKINLILEKLRVLFRISFSRRYINSNQFRFINEQLEEVGKMVGGWMKGQK